MVSRASRAQDPDENPLVSIVTVASSPSASTGSEPVTVDRHSICG
jgi:hypothetical protein